MNKTEKAFDLEERTAKFGEDVIEFCKTIELNVITRPLIDQLVRAATSIGANYMEANGASSKRDFRNKISIAKKESQECKHWFRMIGVASPDCKERSRLLWQEAQEFCLIFGKILFTINKSLKKSI